MENTNVVEIDWYTADKIHFAAQLEVEEDWAQQW